MSLFPEMDQAELAAPLALKSKRLPGSIRVGMESLCVRYYRNTKIINARRFLFSRPRELGLPDLEFFQLAWVDRNGVNES